jgi:hypothetical protein
MQPREIIDQSGNHRLVIHYEPPEDGVPANFHRLVWSAKTGSDWVDRTTIAREDFNRDTDKRRWIQEIHSFDPSTGYAIMKVAEGDVPRHEKKRTRFIYSWREWDVQNNREMQVLYFCKSPHDKYEPVA